MLAAQAIRELAVRIRRARELKKPIIWGIGGHVIKTGLAPVIIDLMKAGYVIGNRCKWICAGPRFGDRDGWFNL